MNLLEIMSESDKQKSLEAFKQRMSGNSTYRKSQKISPEVYLVAELGYYYGWGAVEAVKRGYVETFDETTQKRHKQLFTLEEACVLVEASRKVWYSKVIDGARGTQVGVSSSLSKNPKSTFKNGMDKYIKEARI